MTARRHICIKESLSNSIAETHSALLSRSPPEESKMCRWQLKLRYPPNVCGTTIMRTRTPYLALSHSWIAQAPTEGRSCSRWRFRSKMGHSWRGIVKTAPEYGMSGRASHCSLSHRSVFRYPQVGQARDLQVW